MPTPSTVVLKDFTFGLMASEFSAPAETKEQLQKKLDKALKDNNKLKGELYDYNVELDHAEGHKEFAIREGDRARQKEVARSVIETLRVQLQTKHQTIAKMNQDPNADYYEQATELQKKFDDGQKEIKRLTKVNGELTENIASKDRQLAEREDVIVALRNKHEEDQESIKTNRTNVKEAHEQKDVLARDFDKLYAEFKNEQERCLAASKAKDDAEFRYREATLEIQDLYEQLQMKQHELEETQEDAAEFENLIRDHEGLQKELDSTNDTVTERNHTITIKDARISHLENELQRALVKVEAIASASAASTAIAADPPPIFSSGDESLKDELAELDLSDNEFDYISILEQLNYSNIHEVASIAPVSPASVPASASALGFSAVHSTTVAPIAPQKVVNENAGTQTKQPTTPVLVHSATDAIDIAPVKPVLPTVGLSHVVSLVDISPVALPQMAALSFSNVEHTINISPVASPKKVPTISRGTSASIDTAPIERDNIPKNLATFSRGTITSIETVPVEHTKVSRKDPTFSRIAPIIDTVPVEFDNALEHKQPTVTVPGVSESTTTTITVSAISTVAKTKNKTWSWFNLFMLFLVVLFSYHYQRQQDQLSRVGHGYYSAYRRAPRGAFGNGRHLFGIFPIGFDIGHTEQSERWAAWTNGIILAFENWAGIKHELVY